MRHLQRPLEQIVRGFSNHRRIEMLMLLERRPELCVEDVAKTLRINQKAASEHMRRLHGAGLVTKQNRGREVHLELTPRGEAALSFLRTVP